MLTPEIMLHRRRPAQAHQVSTVRAKAPRLRRLRLTRSLQISKPTIYLLLVSTPRHEEDGRVFPDRPSPYEAGDGNAQGNARRARPQDPVVDAHARVRDYHLDRRAV